MHVQHFKYLSMAVTLAVVVLFVNLIPYLVYESMSATATSPNVVVAFHERNTSPNSHQCSGRIQLLHFKSTGFFSLVFLFSEIFIINEC